MKETEAKFEPFQKANTYFFLYEGMKVFLISHEGKWTKVMRVDGKTGWIKRDCIIPVK